MIFCALWHIVFYLFVQSQPDTSERALSILTQLVLLVSENTVAFNNTLQQDIIDNENFNRNYLYVSSNDLGIEMCLHTIGCRKNTSMWHDIW